MYSQHEEEKYILEAFPSVIGRFLDIGAWLPKDKSNTRALYELGWSGVMIEPSPGPMGALLDEYGNDTSVTLVCAAVGLTAGLFPMKVSDDAVSTSNVEHYESWKTRTSFRGDLTVPHITLEHIARKFGSFDFVSIDAEKLSALLFLRMLDLAWRPRCICVEHDGRLDDLRTKASAAFYLETYSNAENSVFVLQSANAKSLNPSLTEEKSTNA
jgi:FkbM family methyltransferase